MPAIGEKIFIFGASRGLGSFFYKEYLSQNPQAQFYLASRKPPTEFRSGDQFIQFDASKENTWVSIFEFLNQVKPHRIFYFPGGGPYGLYQDKEMKDHLWSLKVNLEFPMHLLHFYLNKEFAQQALFVGSAVAEGPDLKAGSYAAGKAGLKNLLASIAQETNKDLRLFSPGYMNTDLLPPGAKVRDGSRKILDPDTVAQDLFHWIEKPNDGRFHLLYT